MINALYVMNTYRLKAFFLQPRKSLDFINKICAAFVRSVLGTTG